MDENERWRKVSKNFNNINEKFKSLENENRMLRAKVCALEKAIVGKKDDPMKMFNSIFGK